MANGELQLSFRILITLILPNPARFGVFEQYISELTVTKVCQHIVCWDAAAKILLQVVGSVQEGL